MSEPNSNDDEPFLKGPVMNAEGRLERFERMEEPVKLPTSPAQRLEPVEYQGTPEAPPLELVPIAPPVIEPRVEVFRDLPPSRRERQRSRALVVTAGLVALALVIAAGLLVFRPRLQELPFGVSESGLLGHFSSEPVPVIISSTPTGARVTIGSREVGVTPWAGENVWTAETPVRIVAPGFQPWEGRLQPRQPVTLDVQLRK